MITTSGAFTKFKRTVIQIIFERPLQHASDYFDLRLLKFWSHDIIPIMALLGRQLLACLARVRVNRENQLPAPKLEGLQHTCYERSYRCCEPISALQYQLKPAAATLRVDGSRLKLRSTHIEKHGCGILEIVYNLRHQLKLHAETVECQKGTRHDLINLIAF